MPSWLQRYPSATAEAFLSAGEDERKEEKVPEFITGGFGASGEVSALHADAEQSVRAGAVLVHLSAKGDPVSSGHG